MSVLHCRDALAFVAPALSRVDGDGFLREPGAGSAALRYAQHAVVPALAQHARGTARAFGGVWDETAARDAKSWCDELLKMVRSQGDVPRQTVGASLLASAIRTFVASSSGIPSSSSSSSSAPAATVFDMVYARCADGVVWLLKHCRVLTLTSTAGAASLERASFECVEALFAALAASSTGGVSTDLYRNVTPLLGEVVPQLTSRLGLGIAGMSGPESAVALLRTLATSLLLFETAMRPYLGPLRGALLRADLFEHTTVGLQRLAARCWSLVCLSRSKVAVRGKGGSGSSDSRVSYGGSGINGLSTVPAQYWEAECMRVVASTQELVAQMCPSAAQGLKLAPITANGAITGRSTSPVADAGSSDDQVLLPRLQLTDTWPVNEVLVASRLETLATVLSSMLSLGPAGTGLGSRSGSARTGEPMVSIPILSIIDVLDRLIICALNCQVTGSHGSSSPSSGGGLSAPALRSLVPRLYAAFACMFVSLVDAVGTPLLRYASRIGRTILQALKFVSHTAREEAGSLGHGCPCPEAMSSMLECASRLAWRHGAALKQSFVEPVVLLCVREIRVRMVSQPSDSLMLGRITADGGGGGGGNGKRRGKGKGKKRGRNGAAVASLASGAPAAAAGGGPVPSLSTSLLPVSAAAAESHRHTCRACLACINALVLSSGATAIGSLARNDVHRMLYALVGDGHRVDPRAENLMRAPGEHADHSGVVLRLSMFALLETCVVVQSASATSSMLGVAMNAFHSAILDADHRIVQAARRGIAACRPLVYPHIAPMRTFEPRVTPLAKRYKTSWPVVASGQAQENCHKKETRTQAAQASNEMEEMVKKDGNEDGGQTPREIPEDVEPKKDEDEHRDEDDIEGVEEQEQEKEQEQEEIVQGAGKVTRADGQRHSSAQQLTAASTKVDEDDSEDEFPDIVA